MKKLTKREVLTAEVEYPEDFTESLEAQLGLMSTIMEAEGYEDDEIEDAERNELLAIYFASARA